MAILTADELASVRREYRAASLLPCADLPGSGDPRLGARAHPAARLARRRPRGGGPRAGQLPRPRRAGRERAPGPRPGRRGPRVLQRVPPPGHRGRRARVRQGRPLPVPLPRLDLRPRRQPRARQAHRRPRRLQPRHLRPRAHPLPDLAGLPVPVLRRRVGDAGAGDAARRPRRQHGPVRLHEPAVGEADRVRGRRQLEADRRELQRVLPLPGRPSRSSTS